MNKLDLQRELRENYDERYMYLVIKDYREQLMLEPMMYIADWLQQDFDFVGRPDLIEVVNAVDKLDTDEMIWKLLSTVLLHKEITLQGAMAMFFNEIGKHIEMPYRRSHVFTVIVEAVLTTGYVELFKGDKYNGLRSKVSVGDRGQKRYGYVLPLLVPPVANNNSDVAYDGMSAITGGYLKNHKQELCLDHLDRLSSVAYKVEHRVIDMHKPQFDNKPKFKEHKGRYETPDEILKREEEFIRFKVELPEKVQVMMKYGNEFYFGHRYDTRLRTYIKAYHLDFVGNKYCRAFVQPKKGAVVTGFDKY